jgi:hypothetical protein
MYNKIPQYISPSCYTILLEKGLLKFKEEDVDRIKTAAKAAVISYKLKPTEEIEYLKDKEKMNLLCRKISVAELFNLYIEHGVIQIDFPDPNSTLDL